MNAPISACAGQHLVDTEDVVRVYPDTEMESVLAGGLGHVLVRANAGGLEGLRRQLLELVRHQVAAEGEFVDGSTLAAKVENANLGAQLS